MSLVGVEIKLLLTYIALKNSKFRSSCISCKSLYNARGPQQVLVVSSLAGMPLLLLCLTSDNFTIQWESADNGLIQSLPNVFIVVNFVTDYSCIVATIERLLEIFNIETGWLLYNVPKANHWLYS
jgi:hypothetical protein